jgi:MFS family permease
MLGDGVFTVVLALEALRLDRNPAGLSFVLAARLGPAVLLLLAGGVLVDRWPRRPTMLASDAIRAAAVGVIAVSAAAGTLRLWQLAAMAALFGAADAVFGPASTAIVPELLPADLLVQGSALNATSQQVTRMLLGPALGGLIVAAAGYATGFAVDAVSFVVSGACLAVMSSRPRPAQMHASALAQAREGLRYCWSQRWLWLGIVATGIANFAAFSPLAVLVPLLVRRDMHGSPLAVGLVLAAGGVGGAAASVTIGRTGAPRRRVSAMWLAWGAAGVAVALLGAAPDAWVAGVMQALVWGLLMAGTVLWFPLMQELVPPGLLGRASSVDLIVSFVLSPLGVVVAGVAAAAWGPRPVLIGGGVVAALSALVALLPGVRDPESADRVPGRGDLAA